MSINMSAIDVKKNIKCKKYVNKCNIYIDN